MALFLNAFTIGCVKERADIIDPSLEVEKSKRIKKLSSLQTLGINQGKFDSDDSMNLTDAQKASGDHFITTGSSGKEQKLTNAISIKIENDQVAYKATDKDGNVDIKHIKIPKLVGIVESSNPVLDKAMAGITIQAKEDTTYKVVYKASPSHIKVYRVLPDDERSSYLESTMIKGTNLSLIGGIPVTYYKKVYKKTSEGRDTNVLIFQKLDAENYKSAQYFKLDDEEFDRFEAQSKVDYFPADYFTEGEWYYGSTIVSTKPGQEANIGYVSGSRDSSFQKIATKIKFLQQKGSLRGVNVVTDKRIKITDEKRDDVINIPVVWTSYIQEQVGSDVESLKEINDPLVDELDREFGLFNFKDAVLGTGSAAASVFGRFKAAQESRQEVITQRKLDRFMMNLGIAYDNHNMDVNRLYVKADDVKRKYENLKLKKRSLVDRLYSLDNEDYFMSEDDKNNIARYESHLEASFNGTHSKTGCISHGEHIYDNEEGSAEGRLSALFNNHQLKDIKVKENSFSFSILEKSTGIVVKYSFERVKKDSNFNPQVLFDKDQTTYGFFQTDKFKFADYQDRTKRDNEKNTLRTLLNKNKDKGVVKFKFSTITPTIEELRADPNRLNIDYREIGHRVVNYWNRVFQLAKTNMEFKIVDGDAEVGDLDIHIINIVDSVASGNLFGVGPTISDPETGEVISGTVNMYTGLFKQIQAGKIRNYIRFETGQVNEIGLPKELTKVSPSYYTGILIEKRCPEVIEFINGFEKLDKDLLITSDYENKVVNSCIEKTVAKMLSATLAHEMGHTPIQLRHNFMGEADANNGLNTYAKMEQVYPKVQFPELYEEYYPDERLLPQSNSIMEYNDDTLDFPSLSMPGTYDVAAVAFAYGNKVFKKKADGKALGELVPITHEVSLAEQNISDLEDFKFCTDSDASARLFGPMCARWVYGKDPNELMDSHFMSYRYYLLYDNRKLDRGLFFPNPNRRLRAIGLMGDIYLQWRKELRVLFGDNRQYLDTVKVEDLTNESIREQAKGNEELLSYIGVNDKFYTYMKAISEIPNYYCVTLDPETKKVDVIEFTQLQSEYAKTGSETVNGCLDENLVKFVESKPVDSRTIVSEIGYPLQNVKFSTSNDEKFQSVDIGGIWSDRKAANEYLYGRLSSTPSAINSMRGFAIRLLFLANEKKIQPALADEKRFFFKLKSMAENSVLNGSDITNFVSESIAANTDVDVATIEVPDFARFQSEWVLNANKLVNLVSSLNVPGMGPRDIRSHYRLGLTSDGNYINQLMGAGAIANFIPTTDNRFYAAFPDSLFVNLAMDRSSDLHSPLGIVDPRNLITPTKESILNYQALNKIKSAINRAIPINNSSLTSIKYTSAKRMFGALARGTVDDVQENGQRLLDENGQPKPVRNLIDDVIKAPQLYKFLGMINAVATIEKEINDAKLNGQTSITSSIGDKVIDVAKYDEYFKQAQLDNDFVSLAENIFKNVFEVNRVELMKEVTGAIMKGSPEYVTEWNRRLDEKIAGLDSSSEYDKDERRFLSTSILGLLRSLGPVPLR